MNASLNDRSKQSQSIPNRFNRFPSGAGFYPSNEIISIRPSELCVGPLPGYAPDLVLAFHLKWQ